MLVRGRAAGDLFAQVLDSYGIPVARERRTPLARTRLGTGVLAFARAALPRTGTRAGRGHLAAHARQAHPRPSRRSRPGRRRARSGEAPFAPGEGAAGARRWRPARRRRPPPRRSRAPTPISRTGSRCRSAAEARSVREARWHWAQLGGPDLVELDALADAAAEGVEPFLAALLAEADAIWTAPHTRRADVLTPEEEADARAARELRAAVGELTRLAAVDPELAGDPHELLEALAAVEVREGEPAAEGAPGVLLADPLAIRARRFRAVFVCGLQEGELPRRPVPEPFLDDGARAALAVASGLALPRHEDTLPRERSLFYACVSRPEEALFLSFRSSDEEGGPQQPSPFLDDVRALFTPELWEGRGRRLLAEVTWPPAEAPTPHELRRAQAALEERPAPAPLGAPGDPAVLAVLAARDRESARGARGLRRLPGPLADRARPQARPRRPRSGADAPRLARPRGAGAHAARPEDAHRLRAPDARDAARGARRAAHRDRRAVRRRPHDRRARPPRAPWRSTSSATSATRRPPAPATSPPSSSGASTT